MITTNLLLLAHVGALWTLINKVSKLETEVRVIDSHFQDLLAEIRGDIADLRKFTGLADLTKM